MVFQVPPSKKHHHTCTNDSIPDLTLQPRTAANWHLVIRWFPRIFIRYSLCKLRSNLFVAVHLSVNSGNCRRAQFVSGKKNVFSVYTGTILVPRVVSAKPRSCETKEKIDRLKKCWCYKCHKNSYMKLAPILKNNIRKSIPEDFQNHDRRNRQ